MNKRLLLPLILIVLLSTGYIIALHSSRASMGSSSGSADCFLHCLQNAQPLSQSAILIPLLLTLAGLTALITAFVIVRQYGRRINAVTDFFSPYYLFKTVILRE